jgi:hypothetical protein
MVLIKYVLQLISALPSVGEPAFISREIAIAYVHLVMLGIISLGLTGWFGFNNAMILESRSIIFGVKVFLFGFLASEVLLFYPVFVIWFRSPPIPFYSISLFICSFIMFIGTVLIFKSFYKERAKPVRVHS